ncbi:MAG: Tfp pilus assembly protein FimT/FimU [Verrucomicrobium sp.]|nr:prepilin-type N-terminal cleavage/methylation domain-containing protein [Verrucomicrobium sp.]
MITTGTPAGRIHPAQRGGFTLLEMTVVMFIMCLLVGLCVYSFAGLTAEDELRRPATELQRMTMEAVRRASLHEKSQLIIFEPKGFAIRYKSDPDGIRRQEDQQTWVRRVSTPPTMKMLLRRWGSEKFVPAPGQRLVIASSGLCEPLTARFELNGSWLEITLDPLSGRVIDESMNVVSSS